MSEDVIFASEDASLGEIAGMLERHRIKRVPIVPPIRFLHIQCGALIEASGAIDTRVMTAPGYN
jgi:CBS-domain-containing membrane protein